MTGKVQTHVKHTMDFGGQPAEVHIGVLNPAMEILGLSTPEPVRDENGASPIAAPSNE